MKNINILIAEDTKEARDLIVEGLQEYAQKKFGDVNYFTITKADSYHKALLTINESGRKNSYYDIFFADIDFTEDNKGGEKDSGFNLIEKSFEVCPVTIICTYSGQFRAKELWTKYQEFVQKGLIVHTMDKSHAEGGEQKWIEENMDKLLDQLNREQFLFDVWKNHDNIRAKLSDIKFDDDQFEDLSKKSAITANLESALVLLKSKDKFNEVPLIYRLLIYLYHNSLEIFCAGNKSAGQIISDSTQHKRSVEQLLKKELKFADNVTALRTIVSYTKDARSVFGFKLNDFRNKSIHPNEFFQVEFENVLFANLALALYALDRNEISYQKIETYVRDLKSSNYKARKDLVELLNFIKSGNQ